MIEKSTYYWTVCIFILILLGAFGYILFLNSNIVRTTLAGNLFCQYHNINPLRCEPTVTKKTKEYVVLKNNLIDYFKLEKKKGNLITASVFFRDLENGPIMNLNGQECFAPASLLKLPVLISYYEKAQKDPDLLQRRITVPENIKAATQNILPKYTIEKGQTYSIEELINSMIKESDNLSTNLLLEYLDKNFPDEDIYHTLSDLGIHDPEHDENIINVQTYAALFRLLYNSSYLNPEMSNKALDLLAQSEFKDGIEAGVPKEIKVAHKFGERNNGKNQQLHDCGIIYFPDNPYILCVLTKGKSLEDLIPIVRHVSEMVYKEFDDRY